MEFKPEALYERTNLNEIEIIPFETAVVGTVVKYDPQEKQIIVNLGNSWTGIIPEDEFTVYKFVCSEGNLVPKQITGLIDRQIRAIVTEVKENKVLKLSRILSMMQAWYNMQENTAINAYITKNVGYGIFLDLGNGLVSYNSRSDCVALKKTNTRLWFNVGDTIKVKLLIRGKYPGSQIICSHKLLYESIEDDKTISVGDIVKVRIETRINEQGFWCQYNPRISGIIDTDQDLQAGQEVKGLVRAKLKDKGLRLIHLR